MPDVEPIEMPPFDPEPDGPQATLPGLHIGEAAAGLAARREALLAMIAGWHSEIDDRNALIRFARTELAGVDRMLNAAKGPRRRGSKVAS